MTPGAAQDSPAVHTPASATYVDNPGPDVKFGIYFPKKQYVPEPVPTFAEARDLLPNPIMDGRPDLLAMYWKCWELAFRNLKQPPKGSPFVSNWIDAAFNERIFQWDTVFIIMFARYADSIFPAIQSLDNFYCRQHANGYICREIQRADGHDFYYEGAVNSVAPPIYSWAEVESFKLTGDKRRFASVLPPLEKYVEWLNKDGDLKSASGPNWPNYGRKAAGSVHQLYWNTPLGSGMDNSPREGNGWVDMSCQMVIQYNNLATICDELNLPDKAAAFRAEAKAIGDRINKWCWNDADGFYYDVQNDGTQFKVKTSGGFWPLLAGITSKQQADKLVAHLKNEKEFWRPFVFPTLAADEKPYDVNGGYWVGAVWAPTNFVIIKGLEQNGYEDFATEATDKYLSAMQQVFKTTGTVWENYAPELPFRQGKPAITDFVGWTGDGPIALLIENMLGFRCDGVHHRLTWRLTRTDRHGIERLHLGKIIVSAICDARVNSDAPAVLKINANQPFDLVVSKKGKETTFHIKAGDQVLQVP